MKEELLKGLTEEQIEKIKACKSQEELLALAKKEGIELNNEQLEAVCGGCNTTPRCPSCNSSNVKRVMEKGHWTYEYRCNDCGNVFKNNV